MKDKNKFFYIMLLFLISLILFWKPLFSNLPLGLDAIGHLSKISYIKQFGLTSWNYSWYSGIPFLKYYSPLFYILASFFKNSFFGANFLCFLSVFLSSVGIFLLVSGYGVKKKMAFLSSAFFMTTLALSYYWISVGNLPYFFSLFFIPFSLLFLEKSFKNKFLIIAFSFSFALAILSHVFIGFCVGLLSCIRIFLYQKYNIKKFIRSFFMYIFPGLLLSAFWFIPFFKKTNSFSAWTGGYSALPHHLFGFGKYVIWGRSPGEIGVLMFLFVFGLFVFFRNKLYKKEIPFFIFLSSVLFLFLAMGGLGKFYPFGVGAERFVIPLSILFSVFLGIILRKVNFKKFSFILVVILILGLIWSFLMINLNFENYSYGGENSRFGYLEQFNSNGILENNFDNYRFGTMKYIYGEGLNYFYPAKSQTLGYYDQGEVFSEINSLMKDKIWKSNDLNSTKYFLDWFSINLFEVSESEYIQMQEKLNNSEFKQVYSSDFYDYPNRIFYYDVSTGIISYISGNFECYDSFEEINFEKFASEGRDIEKVVPLVCKKDISARQDFEIHNFSYLRSSPNEVEIYLNGKDNSLVLFKEFYNSNWRTYDQNGNEIEIILAGPGFMAIPINESINSIRLVYRKGNLEWFGLFLSFVGIIYLFFVIFNNYPAEYKS